MAKSFGDRLMAAVQDGQAFATRQLARWQNWRRVTNAASEQGCVESLHATSAAERWQAAAALGQHPMRSPEAIAALVAALSDEEEFVRWHAAEALAKQEVGNVFPTLAVSLADADPLRRAGAARSLGLLGGEAATQALLQRTQDPDSRVRAAVAEALGHIADPTALPALLPLLADPEPLVVRTVSHALSLIGSPTSAGALAAALARPGQPLLVRRALAAALARAPHPDAQPELLAALADPDPQVRAYAARGLGQVGNEAAYAALQDLRGDRSRVIEGTVGQRAERALAMLDRRGRRTPPAGKPETEA